VTRGGARGKVHRMGDGGVVVGVLALQGAFAEHIYLFGKIGVRAVEVRLPEHLDQVDALVLPGGESTTIILLAERWGLVSDRYRLCGEWVASAGWPAEGRGKGGELTNVCLFFFFFVLNHVDVEGKG